MTELIQKWLALAENDFEAAEILLEKKKLLLAAFHSQQSLEKFFKMYYLFELNEQPPYIHNLVDLAQRCGLFDQLTETQKTLLDKLNPFYIKARYPSYQKAVSSSLDQSKTEVLVAETGDLIRWIKDKMNL